MSGLILPGGLTKQHMAAALNCAGESIVITDKAGTIQYVNPSFLELTKYSLHEVIGQKPSLWRSDRHTRLFYRDLWRCITGGGIWHGEVTNLKKDRSPYDCLITIAPIWNEQSAIIGYVSTISDVSGYKKLQKQLRQACDEAQKESKARWRNLAYISHDIRTPLNGLLGIISILEDEVTDAERIEYLGTMKRAGQDILAMVDNILDESKLDAQKLELDRVAFDFRTSIHDVQQLLSSKAAQTGSSIQSIVPEELPKVFGDPLRISRVLQNLVGNAIKFTENGTIRLQLEIISEGADDIILQLQVQDTGIGMTDAALATLFQDFSQADATIARRFGGTGLGLSITRKLVDLMGGQITADSKPGIGSTFTLTLPFIKAKPPRELAASRTERSTATTFAGRAALVCDDDELNRKILQRILEKQSMQVDFASNGREGLKRIANHHYDIIFTDVQMPLLDGIAMAQELRQSFGNLSEHVPLIAVTGMVLPATPQLELFDDCVTKPISQQAILLTLNRFLSPH